MRPIARLSLGIAAACCLASLPAVAPATGSGNLLQTPLRAQSAPAGVAAAPPQTAPVGNLKDQRPVFRGSASFVYVDVYPRRDGKVVDGLTAADFQVFEDGKPQTVELFEFLRAEPNTPDAERRDPNTQEDGDRQAADPRNRVFVIYLDLYHTTVTGSNLARRPITEFLDRTISPTDVFGVITPEVLVSQLVFGRRTESVEKQLSQFWTWGQADRAVMDRTPIERQLIQCASAAAPELGELLVRLHREDLLLGNLENLMVRLRDLKDERKNILFISEGWVPQGQHPELASLGSGSVPTVGTGSTGRLGIGNMQVGARDNSWCDRQLGHLAYIDFAQRFRDLLSSARRSNVTFFPVDVGGLRTYAPTAATSGPQPTSSPASARTLRELAENTDGFAIVDTNDLVGAVRRVSDSLSAYYLLGYYSTNTNADGKFRSIEVKTRQPRISVSARRGYLAPTAAMVAAAAAAPSSAASAPSGVDDELSRLGRLRPDAELFSYGAFASGRLDLVVELASRSVEGGRWKNGGDVRATVTGAPGGVNTVLTGRLEPGARAVVLRAPLEKVPTGILHVAVRISGDDGQLEDRTDVAPAAGSLLGAGMVFRGTPSPRSVLKPVADFQFRRTERLHAEWATLKPVNSKSIRLLDRRGQALGQNATVSEGQSDGVLTLSADLNISALAEGEYVLELTAGDGTETDRKLLAFRVVR
ncbi:MAG: VWA domain-containing protein [Vicinamibacterales bacterium]